MPQDLVYHEKYGYISQNKLSKKFIRRDLNHSYLCVVAALVLAGVTAGLIYMLICYGRAVL